MAPGWRCAVFGVPAAPRKGEDVSSEILELGRALQEAGHAVSSYAHIERQLDELRAVKVSADEKLARANVVIQRAGRTPVEMPKLTVDLGESTARVHPTDNLR